MDTRYKAEANCSWHFAKLPENVNDVGPNEPMSENFRKTPYASLIREAIQNSLDVCLDNTKPVEVSFTIKKLQSTNFPNLFEIERNIRECINYYPNNSSARNIYNPMLTFLREARVRREMSYIQVSDSNTKGMKYVKNSDSRDYTTSAFYSFVRSAGVSSKTDPGSGGSFGYGKAAYFYISPIRTLLVSTKTDSGECYFEGVASLCTHRQDNIKRSAIGYYDESDGEPVSIVDDIPRRFQRHNPDGSEKGPGTDINIMGVSRPNDETDEDIYNEMIDAALQNFWMAIFKNKLVVVIGNLTIDSSNIVSLMERRFDEHDMGKRKGIYNPRPFLNTVINADCDDKHVLYTLDLNLCRELKAIEPCRDWGRLEFYMWKTKQATNRYVMMRSLLMTVKVSGARNGEGYYGVFVCPGGYANEVLREMEDPAHKEWSKKRVDSKYKKVAKELDTVIDEFINSSIRKLFKLDEVEVAKIRGIDQYLYIPTEIEDDPDDEDNSTSSFTGNPTGKTQDDGTSLTTTPKEFVVDSAGSSAAQNGSVVIKTTSTATLSESGSMMSGRGNTKIKKPHTSSHVSGAKPNDRNLFDDEASEGTYMQILPVKYRAFSVNKNGSLVHRIVIHADRDVPHAQIDLVVGGEDSDSKLALVYASDGSVSGNSICDVQLQFGSNSFDVKFADKMKHAIKVEAYEIK
jgi:hypothetical protein